MGGSSPSAARASRGSLGWVWNLVSEGISGRREVV
jgi:hypothetical protein